MLVNITRQNSDPSNAPFLLIRDEWDLSKCSLPASAIFTFSRVTWAMQESSKDAQDQVSPF